jgi:hypothetical protein
VCKAGDADALAQQLITLIDDRTALVTMRALALQFAQSRSWTAVWDTLFADYLSVQRAGSVREATSALAHAL